MSSGVKIPEEASDQDEEQASIVKAEKPTLVDAAPLEEGWWRLWRSMGGAPRASSCR